MSESVPVLQLVKSYRNPAVTCEQFQAFHCALHHMSTSRVPLVSTVCMHVLFFPKSRVNAQILFLRVQIKTVCWITGEGEAELADFTPSFLWLLRDFYLTLEEDGRQVEPCSAALLRVGMLILPVKPLSKSGLKQSICHPTFHMLALVKGPQLSQE